MSLASGRIDRTGRRRRRVQRPRVSGSSASVSQAQEFADTAESLGFGGSVAAVTWEDSGGPSAAEDSARETGRRMAGWIEDYVDEHPSVNVRILGHSMGGFVTMELVGALEGYRIENADMIGSYEAENAPCEGNFYDAIERNVAFVGNYHTANDSIAQFGQNGAQCGGGGGGWFGGGGEGSESGSTPPNYHDVDVSDAGSSHGGYKENTGCVQQILDNYGDEIDRGGSGSGGTGGAGDTGGAGGDSDGSATGSGWWGSGSGDGDAGDGGDSSGSDGWWGSDDGGSEGSAGWW